MMQGRSDEPPQPEGVGSSSPASDVPPVSDRADCRTCDLRTRCISWGWMSPGGLWFENAVMLKPRPGCRGFVGRGGDIRTHFTTRDPSVIEH